MHRHPAYAILLPKTQTGLDLELLRYRSQQRLKRVHHLIAVHIRIDHQDRHPSCIAKNLDHSSDDTNFLRINFYFSHFSECQPDSHLIFVNNIRGS